MTALRIARVNQKFQNCEMYASCLVLCLVLVIVTGEVKSTKQLDNIQVTKAFFPFSNHSRRKPLEIDKNENNKLTNEFLKPGQDPRTAESSVKRKRSSNPRAISDLKLRIQRRRTETLCKFCRKSALRMKRALCKRCAHIIPATTEKLTTILPPAISRHGTLTANKKFKKPASIKLNVPVRKINTVSNKDKIGLLQLTHNSNNIRSSENVNNELQNEKFLMASIHKPKVTIRNKLIKTKLQPIKLNNINTNNSDFQLSENKLANIKNRLFPSKIKLSVSPTIKTKEYTISQNNIRKLNITAQPNLQNIRKKLFPSKFQNPNTKITDTVNTNEMNRNIKGHLLNTNSSNLRKTRNEKVETGSSMTMHRNSEQDKIRVLPKANRRKILKSNLINTKNTSEDDKEEHNSNVIENNKRIVLNDLQNNTLPMEKRIHNSRLLNILTRKTNLQKASFADINENGSSNLENVRSKRLKTTNNEENTTKRSNVQLENTRSLTSLHRDGQIGNELKYSNNNKAKLFSGNSAIKKKSAFNIDLNTFELPLFETEITGKQSQLADENLLLSRMKFSNTETNGKGSRSHDELLNKTQRKNDETSQIEISAKKIQHFDRVVKENNITLFKPSGTSLRKIQEGITENINEEHILGKTRKKSDIELRDSVHLTEDAVAMNDEYSGTSEIGNKEKTIDFSGNENKIKKYENKKHRILKINIEKRSTIQSFTNSPQSDMPQGANNTMINRNDQKPTEQSTPESLVSNVPLRSQQFLNRKVYLKHPRLRSTYKNGKHKYVLKMPPKPPYYTSHKWDISGMPITVSTTTVTSAKPELSTTTDTPLLETVSETNLKIKQKTNTGTNSRKAENMLQEHIPNPVLKETQNRQNIHINQHININSENSNEEKIVAVKETKHNATNIRKDSDVMKHLRSQTFLNRNVYLKHPRLKSVYENGKHKYALSDPPKPPYITKYQLNSSDLQRNVIITTEDPDFTNTISSTVTYPRINIKTMSNINSEIEITTNKPNLENISVILNPTFQSTINNKLLIKNDLQIQNKTNFTSRNSEHRNLKENAEKINDDFGNAVTTESSTNTLNINTHLSPQHFLNRKMYLKHPRIASVYENGQHKYILKEPPRPPYQTKFKWDNLGMPLTTSTTMEPNLITINLHQTTESDIHDSVSTTKNNVDEIDMNNIKLESTKTETDVFAVLKNNNNSDENKNGDLTNTKSIATLFNQNQNTKLHKIDSDEIENNSEHFKRYLKSKFISSNLNDNKNMYSNKEMSENQNIFWKYLNMQPEISQEKYENIPIIDNKEQELKEKRMNSRDTIKNQLVESEKISIPINFENITPGRYKSENKINLPLVLKQTENGGFELVLDTNRMCNCSRCDLNKHYVIQENTSVNNEEKQLPGLVYDPKTLSKRKIETNFNKNPLNIFNIRKQNNDMSSTQINNFLQTVKENKMTNDLNEQYLRSQIENKLIKLFQSLKIPVENVHEIYSYINDLPSQEKQVLENYLLNTVTKNFDEESNLEEFKNRFLQNMSSYLNSRFLHSQLNLKPTNVSDIPERTTEGNYRIQLKMESEESDDFRQTSNLKDIDIKALVREEINKELQKLIKDDDKTNIQLLSDNSSEYGKRKKVLNKRHQDFFDEDIDDSSGDVNPRGIIKRKYKIVSNILNWARDCIIKS